MIDTDERRAIVRCLTDALYDYLTIGLTEMERAELARREQEVKQPNFQTIASTEALIEATANINTLRDRIEETRASLAEVPEAMRGVINLTVIGPMEDQLRGLESWQSKLQGQIEKTDVPR